MAKHRAPGWPWGLIAALFTAVVALAFVAGLPVSGSAKTGRAAALLPVASAPSTTGVPWVFRGFPQPFAPSVSIVDDRAVVVGMEVVPGLYRSVGGPACRWSRDAGTTWSTAGSPTATIVVSLAPGSVFETHECGRWDQL